VRAAVPAFADPSWDGAWAGNWEHGNGTQIIFAGNDLVAFYWDANYVDDAQASPPEGGAVIAITWSSGDATLTRDGDATAKIVVRDRGKTPRSFVLKRDQ